MRPCDRACHRGIGCGKRRFGEMSEWFKERAWKVRIPQKGIVGSNPAFSAKFFFLSMPFPARTCGDFLFVDGIISVLIPVSIQALVPILMPVLMLSSRPRKFSATIFLGSFAGPDFACLVRVFVARCFLPGGALRIKSHPFSPILRAPENRSGRSD